jgi:hypothetical protein
MDKHIKITLVEAPAGIANIESLYCSDDLSFDSFPTTPLDDTKEGGAQTDIRDAPGLYRPEWEGGGICSCFYLFLKLR